MTEEEMTKEIIKNLKDVKAHIGEFNRNADRILNLLENLEKINDVLKIKFK